MRNLPDPDLHSARDVLERTAVEVQRCEVILRGIETAVGPMMIGACDRSSSHALQDIDLLGQSLADLATCLSGIAAQLGGQDRIDMQRLLAPMRLDDLYCRLGGRVAPDLSPQERVALF